MTSTQRGKEMKKIMFIIMLHCYGN